MANLSLRFAGYIRYTVVCVLLWSTPVLFMVIGVAVKIVWLFPNNGVKFTHMALVRDTVIAYVVVAYLLLGCVSSIYVYRICGNFGFRCDCLKSNFLLFITYDVQPAG